MKELDRTEKCLLRLINREDISRVRKDPLDQTTLLQAEEIVEDVKERGDTAVREYAVKYGDRRPDEPLVLNRDDLAAARNEVPPDQLALLERTAKRIRDFAAAQLECLQELDTAVPGGKAGHKLIPLRKAGCYAPGGRYPLPSSVLMTAIPARVAGVEEVWVASPRPAPITLAAAAVAGADYLLAVGGAQAVGALAFGTESIAACDTIVGPGNRWVTAAKQIVAGLVKIDMLAGPSELVVVADRSADPETVAIDLLAQAEHDVDALPVLIADSDSIVTRVREELWRLLQQRPTETAEASLRNGFAIIESSLGDIASIVNQLAPEHLQLSINNYSELIPLLTDYGGLFIGSQSAEVFGDYGVGPNHVLPTSGAAARTAGLSVAMFLRQPTWLRMDQLDYAEEIISDTAALAELEGLYWHSRAALARKADGSGGKY